MWWWGEGRGEGGGHVIEVGVNIMQIAPQLFTHLSLHSAGTYQSCLVCVGGVWGVLVTDALLVFPYHKAIFILFPAFLTKDVKP